MAVLSAYFDLGTSVRRIAEYAGMFSDADLFEIQPLMPYMGRIEMYGLESHLHDRT